MIANHNFRRVIQKGLAVLAALLLSGCPDTLGGGGPADTKALAAAIASAQSAKTGVLSSVDGADVPEESYWASAAAFAALNDAIAAGETALGDGAATQAVVDDAAAALTAATAAFVAAKQQGTAVAAADKAALVAAIASAQTAKTGVTVSVDGTDVPESGWWTTRAALDALNNAVAAAETVSQNAAATQDEADAAAATLAEATDTFTAAKQPGTGSGVEAADKTALVTAIASAQAAKTGVAVSADGTDVPESGWWTTRAALDALNNAVAAAEAVSHNASVTQDDADNTAATLIEATVTFTAAKQPGTYVPPADRTALATAIEEAQAAKTGVVVSSTNGANVSPDRQWVNASVLAALNDTIAAAETVFQNAAATQAETDAATATLTEATATFTAAKQSGLKGAAVITVSPQGLGISFNLRFVDPPGPGGFASGAYGTATITKGYWMGETEVTQELFEAVMGANPSYFTVGAASGEIQRRRPVDQASWYAAIAFCNKLSLLDGKTPAYSVKAAGTAAEIDWANLSYDDIPGPASGVGNANWDNAVKRTNANGYRLPYEMEWLWAAMGGTKGGPTVTINGYAKPFAGSDGTNSIGAYAWYGGSSSGATAGGKTHEAGKKLPNELGLYDMTGNVAEWCFEPEGSAVLARHSRPEDPAKTFHGGGWSSAAALSAIAWQGEDTHDHPSYRFLYVGFRIVRDQ